MRRRILIATMLAVAVTAVVLGLPLGFSALKVVGDFARTDLSNRAQQIATLLDEQVATQRPINLRAVQILVPDEGRLDVRTPNSHHTYGAAEVKRPLVESVPMVRKGMVTLSIPGDPVHTQQAQVATLVLLLVVLSAGTGMIVATLTANRLSEPLRHVAARAARLGAGDFRADETRHGVPELDRVAVSLDASAAALSHLIQRERDLVGDVSHQLRSRLTALQLRLEALGDTDDPVTGEEATAALEQAERLSEVLDDLLAAATAARAREAEPLDVSAELPEVAVEWREPLRTEGRALRLRVADGLLARATPGRLREAIGVLLDNALRHGSGSVTLAARHGNGMVIIEVTDNGPGIPEELVPHIFERGFSGGGSTGVGLALARALIEADGGRLELGKARPVTFEIFLREARADDVLGLLWKFESTPR